MTRANAAPRPSSHTTPVGLDRLFRKRLVICVGPGGVGKTTTAAALAMAGALRGHTTAVITVDPARRLKDALGIGHLSGEPHTVPLGSATSFDALALDTKRMFDALIQRFAPTAATAARIRANRLYQELSNELSGSTEYMAMEKLHELTRADRYQLLIVDTPPSAHIRDLLAAPNRLLTLLGSRALSLLQAPTTLLGGSSGVGRFALSTLLKALERWTGFELLRDVSDFVASFEGMTEGFSTRATDIERLLRASTTAFVLVTSADPHTVETTIDFHRELKTGGLPVAGVIANRVAMYPPIPDLDAVCRRWPEPLPGKLSRMYTDLQGLARRDQDALERLCTATKLPLLAVVPTSALAPTSLSGLRRFARRFTGTAGPDAGASGR